MHGSFYSPLASPPPPSRFPPPPHRGRRSPDVLRPGFARVRGSIVLTLRPCMLMSTPPPAPPLTRLLGVATFSLFRDWAVHDGGGGRLCGGIAGGSRGTPSINEPAVGNGAGRHRHQEHSVVAGRPLITARMLHSQREHGRGGEVGGRGGRGGEGRGERSMAICEDCGIKRDRSSSAGERRHVSI